MAKDIKYLKRKRCRVLKEIKQLCETFEIKDYDYIVKDEPYTETLRIYNDYYDCTTFSRIAEIKRIILFWGIGMQTSISFYTNVIKEEENDTENDTENDIDDDIDNITLVLNGDNEKSFLEKGNKGEEYGKNN